MDNKKKNSKFNKKSSILIVIIAISALYLCHSFKDINFYLLRQEFSKTNATYIFLWIVIFLISGIIRSLRWRLLLNDNSIPVFDLFHSMNIGNLASMVLPFRAGEFIRPYYLNEWSKIGFSRALVSVILERVFDVLGMLTFFFLFAGSIKELPTLIEVSLRGLPILTLILIIGMLLARFLPERMDGLFRYVVNYLPNSISSKLTLLFSEVILGLGSIRTISQLAQILIWTILLWWSYAYSFSLVLASLGEENLISVGAVISVFVALAIAAPSAPGFLLTFELGCTAALGVFAYSKEFSLAFAIIAHGLQFFFIIFIGIYSLIKKGLTFSSLRQRLPR